MSSERRPPRHEPRARSWRQALPLVPHKKRLDVSEAFLNTSRSDLASLGGMFVDPDEIAQSDRKFDILGSAKRIHP